MKFCMNCNVEIDENNKFCPYCGKNNFSFQEDAPDSSQDLKDIPILQRPQSGINRSIQSEPDYQFAPPYQMQQNDLASVPPQQFTPANSKSPLLFIIPAAITVIIIALLVFFFGLHTCEDCNEKYFGSKNEIVIFGEEFELCDDCYEDANDIF